MTEVITELLAQFGGTAGMIVILALWVNRKFNELSTRLATLEGWKEGHTED